MQKIRDEEEQQENAKWENWRQPFLEELKAELQESGRNSMIKRQIIDFLWAKYPTKHNENPTKPSEDLSDQNRLMKMNKLHHPDRIDEEKYGTKYKVLNEEITKMLNYKYERLKKGF
jgi:hypothetical protein